MFGTLGFPELIIICVIVLIIFGAGRLPQIGEGIGKALKGFKKEVQDASPAADSQPAALPDPQSQPATLSTSESAEPASQVAQSGSQTFQPGPEQTPGTTAAQAYSGVRPEPVPPPQPVEGSQPAASSPATPSPPPAHQPISMEQRAEAKIPQPQAQYPPLPPTAVQKPGSKRPSAIVNKEAVARVQAQRAAMQANAAKGTTGTSPQDLQSLGEGLGSALRTFRQATADVRNTIDPEMRTIQAELEAAQKEVEESVELVKQPLLPKEPPPTS